MGFGGEKKSGREVTTTTMPEWLTSAGQGNLDFATSLRDKGFQPYTGQQVASFSPQQQASFGLGDDIAGGIAPYVGQTGQLISNFANSGPQRVSADSISSRMSPYMNAYVDLALRPQLDLQSDQFAAQNKSFDSAATGAGAFGDTGWGLGRTNLTKAQDLARSGLIGNAYNAAFNTAIGAGAQDVSNDLNAKMANANFGETALGRQLTGANALAGQGTQATNLINTLGGQQTAQSQAGLNALFNQWMMAQQYPFQTASLVNQTLGATKNVSPITQEKTKYAPDNSGYGLIGAGLSLAAAPFTGGMSLAAMPSFFGGMGGGGGGMSGGAGSGYDPNTNMPLWSADGTRPLWAAADGGTIPAGQPTVVGERGPEVIIPNANSVVIPNEVLRAAQDKRKAALDKNKKKPPQKPAEPALQFGLAA